MNVPCVEESLASCRRLGRDAEGDLLGDVALAISVQFGAPLGSGSEMERKSSDLFFGTEQVLHSKK